MLVNSIPSNVAGGGGGEQGGKGGEEVVGEGEEVREVLEEEGVSSKLERGGTGVC